MYTIDVWRQAFSNHINSTILSNPIFPENCILYTFKHLRHLRNDRKYKCERVPLNQFYVSTDVVPPEILRAAYILVQFLSLRLCTIHTSCKKVAKGGSFYWLYIVVALYIDICTIKYNMNISQ